MKSIWKIPPRAKVYEALSAVADARVDIQGFGAEVTSSGGEKRYHLEWSPDGRQISSNDNASFYQGYMGYPIVAVLLTLGRIPYDPAVAAMLKGIPWKRLNTKHKRNYEKAIDEALSTLPGGADARAAIESHVDEIYGKLGGLSLERGPVRRPPPK